MGAGRKELGGNSNTREKSISAVKKAEALRKSRRAKLNERLRSQLCKFYFDKDC
jgi:hypothetical protein